RAYALEDRVRALSFRELSHMLDSIRPALTDDVRGPERARKLDPSPMASQEDDPLGAEAIRGDHTAEANGAVTDYRDGLARCNACHDRGMVAGAHDVRKREQR